VRIVSSIQNSFQEYEDHISLVLFCFGCNLDCCGCYNHEAISNPDNIQGTVKDVIDERLTPLDDAIVFLGGEPTVWAEDLPGDASYAKSKRRLVKIFTNGTRPAVLRELNRLRLVDFYSIDLKTVTDAPKFLRSVTPMSTDEYLMLVGESIRSVMLSGVPLEIRTTAWKELDDLDKTIGYVAEHFPGVKHIVQPDFRDTISKLKMQKGEHP
jgi:pyruvate-formate lyase-activating enzyme